MFKKTPVAAGIAALASMMIVGGVAVADADNAHYYTEMTPHELADYLIFEADGFFLDQEVQEGGTTHQRMVQDDMHKACSVIGGGDPDQETLQAVREAAAESIVYPEGGIQLGDWERGRELAWSGFGYRVGHRTDDHSARPVGGNCYNCHQMATDRVGGNIGPSLTGYGKTRGNNEAVRKFVYEMNYNPHAYFPCTNMPRMGHKGLLTQTQIADIMAYILDPESPVNQ